MHVLHVFGFLVVPLKSLKKLRERCWRKMVVNNTPSEGLVNPVPGVSFVIGEQILLKHTTSQ